MTTDNESYTIEFPNEKEFGKAIEIIFEQNENFSGNEENTITVSKRVYDVLADRHIEFKQIIIN